MFAIVTLRDKLACILKRRAYFEAICAALFYRIKKKQRKIFCVKIFQICKRNFRIFRKYRLNEMFIEMNCLRVRMNAKIISRFAS